MPQRPATDNEALEKLVIEPEIEWLLPPHS
jgi:hypothetical protein